MIIILVCWKAANPLIVVVNTNDRLTDHHQSEDVSHSSINKQMLSILT